jgi:ribosomal protein L37AE/L43A
LVTQIVHWRMPDALGNSRYACGTRRSSMKLEDSDLDKVTCRRCLNSQLARIRLIIWVQAELDQIKAELADVKRRIG